MSTVWVSEKGYSHQAVGQKVSQIQAVLARRCAAIGELQTHLLRAGWQRGVAQWGVLGQGDQWAAVAGFDGSVENDPRADGLPYPTGPINRRMSSDIGDVRPLHRTMSSDIVDVNFPRSSSRIGLSDTPYAKPSCAAKNDGGGIFIDDPAFLTQWSVDALALVRSQLFRAANGMITLPYQSNWVEDVSTHSEGELIAEPDEEVISKLPLWASITVRQRIDTADTESSASMSFEKDERAQITISDLPLMVKEVSELLDVTEDIMDIQRRRRLEKLRPPGWLRRNWYVVGTVVPSASYFVYQMACKGYAQDMVKFASQKISDFFRERLRDPLVAM
jgi:hypothetical protein